MSVKSCREIISTENYALENKIVISNALNDECFITMCFQFYGTICTQIIFGM